MAVLVAADTGDRRVPVFNPKTRRIVVFQAGIFMLMTDMKELRRNILEVTNIIRPRLGMTLKC